VREVVSWLADMRAAEMRGYISADWDDVYLLMTYYSKVCMTC
jgi:hypothetical protein